MGVRFWQHPNSDIRVFKKNDRSVSYCGSPVSFTNVQLGPTQITAHYLVKRDRDYTLEFPDSDYTAIHFTFKQKGPPFANAIISDHINHGFSHRLHWGPRRPSTSSSTFYGKHRVFVIHFFNTIRRQRHVDYTLEIQCNTVTPRKTFKTELVFRVLACR